MVHKLVQAKLKDEQWSLGIFFLQVSRSNVEVVIRKAKEF